MIKKNNKYNFTEEEQKLYDKLIKLSKTTRVRPKLISSKDSYQFISNKYEDNEDDR
jgi:hypothetical protein